jgi:hypothetical protein
MSGHIFEKEGGFAGFAPSNPARKAGLSPLAAGLFLSI